MIERPAILVEQDRKHARNAIAYERQRRFIVREDKRRKALGLRPGWCSHNSRSHHASGVGTESCGSLSIRGEKWCWGCCPDFEALEHPYAGELPKPVTDEEIDKRLRGKPVAEILQKELVEPLAAPALIGRPNLRIVNL